MATVLVPESLARLFPGMPRQLTAEGVTTLEVIDGVNGAYPGFRDRVCETRTRIRRHVLLFVDGAVAELDTPLSPGSELLIVPALSGGA
jgi:molybdopterin converting factor small subunit